MAIKDLIPWKKRVPDQVQETTPFSSLQQRMDRLFDEFWQDSGMAPFRAPSGPWAAFSPSIDIIETDKTVEIQAELPGMDEKDIEVTLSGRTLTISGEKREDKEEKGGNYTYTERSYGSFQRTVTLPENVQDEPSKAVFRRGVLHINFAKTAEPKKTITIQAR